MKQDLLDQIKVIIGEEFGVMPDILIGPRQSDYVSTARHVLSLTLYNLGLSTVAVGAIIGKDHSTVIHSKKVYYSLCKTDEYFKIRSENVEKKVKVLIFGEDYKSK
jgi:chromosomal replication initiation ATPase DnaA